jgi:hypothetical protein
MHHDYDGYCPFFVEIGLITPEAGLHFNRIGIAIYPVFLLKNFILSHVLYNPVLYY